MGLLRTRIRQFQDLTQKDIDHIHAMMRQGVPIKVILKQLNISQKVMNMLFERNKFGKPSNNLNNKNNENNKSN